MTDTVNVPQEMIDAVMRVAVGVDEYGSEVFPGPFVAAELVRVALAAASKAEPVGGSIAEVVADLVNETAPDQGNVPSRAFALALSLQASLASKPEAPKVEQEPVAWRYRPKNDPIRWSEWTTRRWEERSHLIEECAYPTHPAPANDELIEAAKFAAEAIEAEIEELQNSDNPSWTGLHNALVTLDEAIAKHKGPQS